LCASIDEQKRRQYTAPFPITRSVKALPLAPLRRFCQDQSLPQLRDRSHWRTVIGGSRDNVNRLAFGITAFALFEL
jgi:predicted NAD/FAD-binding protein